MVDNDVAPDKSEGLLTSVAESIGTALGSLAAKANAAQRSLGKSTAAVVRKVTPSKKRASSRRKKRRPAKKSRAKRGARAARSAAKRTRRRSTGRKTRSRSK